MSTPAAGTPGWVVVATEDDPARAEWSGAAREVNVAQPRFVPWSDVLGSEAEFQAGDVVFAERLYPCVPDNPVGGQRARYADLGAALHQLDAAVAKAGATSATPAEPTLLALDRAKRDAFLRQSGVPVLELSDIAEAGNNILRPQFAGSDDWSMETWRTRLFRHRTRTGVEVWRAPATGGGNRQELAHVAALLADDGIHAVSDLHRVHLNTAFHDFRFAVLDGKVTHAAGLPRDEVVLREWYGGRRLEIDAFLKRFGMERWERLVALAERAATYFPGIRSLGVDLIMDNDKAEFVFDVDPFGASLPGIRGGLPSAGEPQDADGEPLSVRAAVLRALSAGS